MTEAERLALGQTRRLVFSNVANGVPLEGIREAMRLSDLEIDQALKFVARKITDYQVFKRGAPIPCADAREIRYNRRPLLFVLAKLTDFDLSTPLVVFSKVTVQAIDHPEMVQGMSARMADHVRTRAGTYSQ